MQTAFCASCATKIEQVVTYTSSILETQQYFWTVFEDGSGHCQACVLIALIVGTFHLPIPLNFSFPGVGDNSISSVCITGRFHILNIFVSQHRDLYQQHCFTVEKLLMLSKYSNKQLNQSHTCHQFLKVTTVVSYP